MTIFEQVEQVKKDAEAFLATLPADFRSKNSGKTIVIFPYIKQYEIDDDPLVAVQKAEKKFPNELGHSITL